MGVGEGTLCGGVPPRPSVQDKGPYFMTLIHFVSLSELSKFRN